MDRQSSTLLLLALVVLGGTSGLLRTSEDKSPMGDAGYKVPDAVSSSGYASPGAAPVELISRFFKSSDPSDRESRAEAGAKLRLSSGDVRATLSIEATAVSNEDDFARSLQELKTLQELSEKIFDMKFMVATVPDPIDSHVGWQFDPVIDAIQRAFEAERFVLDRFYFPWQIDTPKRSDPSKIDLPIHARYPGVILFRSAALVPSPTDEQLKVDRTTIDKPQLHVVLLVGETPTRGIHKIALARALDVIAAWEAATQRRKKSPALHVRILGPAFSGSSMSLRLALEEWAAGASGIPASRRNEWGSIEFRIVSGRVQDLRNKPTLHFKLTNLQQRRKYTRRTSSVESTFHSTMVPSTALNECMFANYLDQRNHVDRRDIALLVEANTVYGEQISVGASAHPQAWGLGEGSPEQQPIILQYPMQIGRTRAAYQHEQALLPEDVRAEQGLPRIHLELRLEENPTANDIPPAFSNLSETAMASLMEDMLAALGRSGIRYLGIIGTDPMDILFLARLAHQSCPDAQLFTTGADLLFTHAAYSLYMDGTECWYSPRIRSSSRARRGRRTLPTSERDGNSLTVGQRGFITPIVRYLIRTLQIETSTMQHPLTYNSRRRSRQSGASWLVKALFGQSSATRGRVISVRSHQTTTTTLSMYSSRKSTPRGWRG